MDSIKSLLSEKDFSEPEEIDNLKKYIKSKYDSYCEIRLNPKGLIIVAESSALANTIKLNLPEIKRELNIGQRVVVRIR